MTTALNATSSDVLSSLYHRGVGVVLLMLVAKAVRRIVSVIVPWWWSPPYALLNVGSENGRVAIIVIMLSSLHRGGSR